MLGKEMLLPLPTQSSRANRAARLGDVGGCSSSSAKTGPTLGGCSSGSASRVTPAVPVVQLGLPPGGGGGQSDRDIVREIQRAVDWDLVVLLTECLLKRKLRKDGKQVLMVTPVLMVNQEKKYQLIHLSVSLIT